MTDTKFTPGPWVFEPERKTYEGGFYAGDVEICNFGDSETYYNTCGTPPNIHDAHLIAAAPDLYDALEAMVKYVNAEPGTMGYPGTQAASALAKARGTQ